MNRYLLIPALVLLSAGSHALASTVLADNFDSYTNGNLVGQGDWLQTGGGTATIPIQVLDGAVALSGLASAQDAYKAFTAPISALSAGDVITTTVSLTINTATAGGDYFLHLSSPAGTTTNFYQRFYAKSSGTGFLFGLAATSGTATYGTLELSLATQYSVALVWNVLEGADTFSILVNGASYLEGVTFASGEPTSLEAINLRQASGNAPGVSITELSVDYTAVPEPGTVALVGLGLGAVLFGIRRKGA